MPRRPGPRGATRRRVASAFVLALLLSGCTPTPSTTHLNLPRVPWEGGPEYYRQFPKSAGYTDPNVFPIGAWWASFDSDANVTWDKGVGINTYILFNPDSPGQYVGANGMFYINDGPAKGSSDADPAWLGWWTADEADGWAPTQEQGIAHMQDRIAAQGKDCDGGHCRFAYANYTGFVTSDFGEQNNTNAARFINLVPGPVSVDGYYYTDPSCDDPDRRDYQINAPDNAHCRSAASYGNFIDNLRARDVLDGKLQPLWGFVENGAPGANGKYIQPEQMGGAAWSMIINEARGIVWFNQSFSGSCQTGNVIRDAQTSPTNCNSARVDGMRTVNAEIQSLAPILNTQSYQWEFGAGLNTMLKAKDGHAYIFSMIGLNTDPGHRTFTLPPDITGSTVEVVGEGRTLPVVGGKFTDSFAAEYTHHVYKVVV